MLHTHHAFSGFAATDTAVAKTFYGEKLGLDVRDGREAGLIELHLPGGAMVIVYPKPDYVPATYTVLNFQVKDIDVAVDELVAAGITLARYPGAPQDEKGIVRGNGPTIAWFTDPAGNILSVIEDGDPA
jgi:predicted enzyme related to lactoylglutathione lyase